MSRGGLALWLCWIVAGMLLGLAINAGRPWVLVLGLGAIIASAAGLAVGVWLEAQER